MFQFIADLRHTLAKYSEIKGDVSGLEAAVSAFEKSLVAGDDQQVITERAATLYELGQTLVTLAARTGDRSYKQRARTVFEQAYDAGAAGQLHSRAHMSDEKRMRLHRAGWH